MENLEHGKVASTSAPRRPPRQAFASRWFGARSRLLKTGQASARRRLERRSFECHAAEVLDVADSCLPLARSQQRSQPYGNRNTSLYQYLYEAAIAATDKRPNACAAGTLRSRLHPGVIVIAAEWAGLRAEHRSNVVAFPRTHFLDEVA